MGKGRSEIPYASRIPTSPLYSSALYTSILLYFYTCVLLYFYTTILVDNLTSISLEYYTTLLLYYHVTIILPQKHERHLEFLEHQMGEKLEKHEKLEKVKMESKNGTCGGPIRSTKIDTLALAPSVRIVFYDRSSRCALAEGQSARRKPI